MPQALPDETKECHLRDELDPSAIIAGSWHRTPSTCLVAALEAVQVKPEKTIERKGREVKATNVLSKDTVVVTGKSSQTVATAKSKTTHSVKIQTQVGLPAPSKMQVVDRLSSVPEREEPGNGADDDNHTEDEYVENEEDAGDSKMEEDCEEEDGEDEKCRYEIVFLILVCDQWEQDATHKHSVNFDPTADQVILSIQTVIGSVKIPMDRHPPPVVKLAKSSSLWISLKTKEDWEHLKTLWEAEYMKKCVAYDINIVMTKKMMKDIEEAMNKYTNNGNKGKSKGKAAKKKNPYLSDKSSDDGHGPGDSCDLNAEGSDEYKGKLQLLKQCWPCEVHSGKICLGDKSELSWALAMTQGVEGVDIENPLHSDPFKAWYQGTAIVPHRAGARMIENQYDTNAGHTHHFGEAMTHKCLITAVDVPHH
ncbi:hypothetical protein K439DRAFT_1623886 [Ramaria rubella]|nr:hypothetical protein K439DRAFT_1623886 [Ramaria rubella]